MSQRISDVKQVFGSEITIDVITSGVVPPNPAELLDSETFAQFLDSLRKEYQFVIVDCPPTLPVADASIISTRTDGVLVVTAAGVTRKNQFFGVREAITNVGGQILGVVLNKIPHSRTYDDYGYKYGYGYGYKRKYGGYRYSGYKSYKPYAAKNDADISSSEISKG
jgi:capsular exopolysaccharide synthesis family protein